MWIGWLCGSLAVGQSADDSKSGVSDSGDESKSAAAMSDLQLDPSAYYAYGSGGSGADSADGSDQQNTIPDPNTALLAYNQAVMLYATRQYVAAKECLEDAYAAASEPDSGVDSYMMQKLCLLLLDLYIAQKQPAKAMGVLERLNRLYRTASEFTSKLPGSNLDLFGSNPATAQTQTGATGGSLPSAPDTKSQSTATGSGGSGSGSGAAPPNAPTAGSGSNSGSGNGASNANASTLAAVASAIAALESTLNAKQNAATAAAAATANGSDAAPSTATTAPPPVPATAPVPAPPVPTTAPAPVAPTPATTKPTATPAAATASTANAGAADWTGSGVVSTVATSGPPPVNIALP